MAKKELSKKNKSRKKKIKERPRFDVHSEAIKALWGVVLAILFFVSILAFIGKAGALGAVFSDTTKTLFGVGRFIIPFVFLAASYILFSSGKRNSYVPLVVGGVLFFSGVLGLFNIFSSNGSMSGGGYLGYFVSMIFISSLGKIASFIIFLGIITASIIISFNIRITKVLGRIKERKEGKQVEGGLANGDNKIKGGAVSGEKTEFKVKTWQSENEDSNPSAGKQEDKSKEKSGDKKTNDSKKTSKEDGGFDVKNDPNMGGDFRLPPLELLEQETGRPSSGDIVANANIIKRTLQNFGIEIEMGEVSVGPTVTQFTLKPAEGVKLSRILALHNDLSLALAVHPIRIEAPIPGRSLVGIEIPNKGFSIVKLKNLLESSKFKNREANLMITLGRDVSGAAIVENLAKMPHLLIAGSTGSGKSISLNIVILSLLYQNPPNLLKFILIDPKRVEFPVYSDIPHLLAPVVVDTQKTVNAFKWAVSEMERRFEILSKAKVRDIASFNANKKIVAEYGPLPYIIIVVDELADLMASRGKEIEALVVRLAQMARAVGMHLILATQRPSVEVITGLIKANITTRIAFQVASQIDSRTVLDMAGAEKLLGNGDMLFLSGDASKPKRIQGAYVTEKEVRRVADYLREEGFRAAEKEEGSSQEGEGDAGLDFGTKGVDSQSMFSSVDGSSSVDFEEVGDSGLEDELYEEARKVVIQAQKASSSLLQRRLRVGYARAARLIDMLEENNVIGQGEGAKPRQVYVEREESE